MVLHFQASCFEVPLNAADAPHKKIPTKKVPKRRFVERRKQQMQDVITETRIWALASALPLHSYAPKSCGHFQRNMEKIATRIFGPQVSERKIRAIFGRIGLDLLAPPEQHHEVQAELSEDDIKVISRDWLVPYSIITHLCVNFSDCDEPDEHEFFDTTYLTWGQLQQYALDFPFLSNGRRTGSGNRNSEIAPGHSLNDVANQLQATWVRKELGLPSRRPWTREEWKQAECWENHRNGDTWDYHTRGTALGLASRDTFAIRAVLTPYEGRNADIWWDENIITLYPSFFTGMCRSISDFELQPNITRLEKPGDNCPETFIHEVTHSKSLLSTVDTELSYRTPILGASYSPDHQMELQNQDCQPGDQFTTRKVYGDELVFMLGARCTKLQYNSSEECADSWATFSRLRLLTLVYPEYCFINSWKAELQDPSHSCSLFDCLRHPSAGSIRDLPGYDRTLDPIGAYSTPDWEELLRILTNSAKEQRTKELDDHMDKARRLSEPARQQNVDHADKNSKEQGSASDDCETDEFVTINLNELRLALYPQKAKTYSESKVLERKKKLPRKKELPRKKAREVLPKSRVRKSTTRAQKRGRVLREHLAKYLEETEGI